VLFLGAAATRVRGQRTNRAALCRPQRKDAEYSRLELEAFNEYARRRGKPPGHPSLSPGEPTSRAPARPSPAGPRASGYRGVAKPVHQANATDGTQARPAPRAPPRRHAV